MQNLVGYKYWFRSALIGMLGMLLVACESGTFRIGGEVIGLEGTGLVLLNNSEDNLPVASDGAFEFDRDYTFSYPYRVTVGTQPVNPLQACVVSNGVGRLTKNVNNVRVDCRIRYTVGGTIQNLEILDPAEDRLVLLLNSGEDTLTLTTDIPSGGFVFPKAIVDGSNYEVTISTQPVGQRCKVLNGKGVVDGANIADVEVICGTLTVGGAVTGLNGTLVLQNNAGDNLELTASGSLLPFTFFTKLAADDTYAVTVFTNPTGQRCTVTDGVGTVVADTNVTTIAVNCKFTVGGTVTGLVLGRSVTLQNNGTDDFVTFSNSRFTFDTPLDSGDLYEVTVAVPPSLQSCSVTNGAGTIAAAAVTDIAVVCNSGPTLAVDYDIQQVLLSWAAVGGADFYRVMKSINGGTSYDPLGSDTTAVTSFDLVSVHLADWVNTRYKIQSWVGAVPTDSNVISVFDTAQATGYFKASNAGAGDNFGNAVALSGDGNTLAVGANLEDSVVTEGDNGAVDSGAVYVFALNGTNWSQQAYIKASNAGAGDQFGSALALSSTGDSLAIGARGEDSAATAIGGDQTSNAAQDSGAVYVFSRSNSIWTQQSYIKASNTDAGDQFGYALALARDGNTLAVGANLEDSAATVIGGDQTSNAAQDSGAVYVFAWNSTSSSWSQEAYIKASNAEAGDQFGNALALSGVGNTLAVGANLEDSAATVIGGDQTSNAELNSGAVYVFARDGVPSWSEEAYVKASNTQSDDQFGYALALSQNGNTLAVGAIGEDSAVFLSGGGGLIDDCAGESLNCAQNSGAAYVYTRTGAVWSQPVYIKALNAEAGDQFGYALSMDSAGDVLVVGANSEDGGASGVIGNMTNNSADDSGAAYLLTNTSGSWTPRVYVKASNTGAGDTFGDALAISDDGATLAVGATQEDSASTGINATTPGQGDNTASNSGAVYLY